MDKNTKNNVAAIKTYSKTQLADMYKVDVRTLVSWINRDKNLKKELEFMGYRPKQRYFNPKQVNKIFTHFGRP